MHVNEEHYAHMDLYQHLYLGCFFIILKPLTTRFMPKDEPLHGLERILPCTPSLWSIVGKCVQCIVLRNICIHTTYFCFLDETGGLCRWIRFKGFVIDESAEEWLLCEPTLQYYAIHSGISHGYTKHAITSSLFLCFLCRQRHYHTSICIDEILGVYCVLTEWYSSLVLQYVIMNRDLGK